MRQRILSGSGRITALDFPAEACDGPMGYVIRQPGSSGRVSRGSPEQVVLRAALEAALLLRNPIIVIEIIIEKSYKICLINSFFLLYNIGMLSRTA